MSANVPERPTVWDVARAAGVSKSTVSRVLTNDTSVAPATRERVNLAVASLGYTRDFRGRALRTGRTSIIGFIVPDLANPVYSAIAAVAQQNLYEAGYTLMLAAYGTDAGRQSSMVENFISRGIDAVGITPMTEGDGTLAVLESSRVPCVLLDREHPGGRFDSVTCAHGDAITQALQHLAGTGHDCAVIIDRPAATFPGRDSQRAVKRFAENSPMEIRHLPASLIAADEAYDALLSQTFAPGKRIAIVATSSLLMVGALRGLGVLGLKPGRDVSFIGTDDSSLSGVFEPPITALHRDLSRVGSALSILLLEWAMNPEGEREPTRVHIPMRLIRRASVLSAT